jgi:arginyl-tRNA synthetase
VGAALKQLGAAGDPEFALPPNPEMGDLGFPCFAWAKAMRKAPPLIAQEIAARLKPDELIERVSTDKAYVNITWRKSALFRIAVGEILREGSRFGAGQARPAQHFIVEYSAPNTNKPLHLGHLRNNCLGASIVEILRFYGHRVTAVNLINDRGVHICKSMLYYQRWGEGTSPDVAGKKGDHLVGDFYVNFDRKLSEEYSAWQQSEAARAKFLAWKSSEAGREALLAAQKEQNGVDEEKLFFSGYKDQYFNSESKLGAQVRQLLIAWEEGDENVRGLWRKMNRWVIAGFEQTYDRMGVKFDFLQYESETYKLGKKIVEEGLSRGILAQRPDGAVVCDLAQVGLKGEKVLLRSDGTSVYMTQDLGTAVERYDRFAPQHMVYVVGDEQVYHFDVLFRVLGLMRPELKDACYHLAYGMIRLPEGRMKSREGTVVDADDLLDETHRLAAEETASRAAEGKVHTEGISEEELEHRAEHIALAAIKYYLLKHTPRKSFEYDPKESIDFLGQTGPYCLFNYARTRSLLRKAGGVPAFDAETAAHLGTDKEVEILRLLMNFPEAVRQAAANYDPSRVTEYLFELCKVFAFIFTDKANHPIVTCEDQQLRQARLMLVGAVGNVLSAGLALLGIVPLEEM